MTTTEFLRRCAVEDLADAERDLHRARRELVEARASLHRARAVHRHALDRCARQGAERMILDAIEEAEAITDAHQVLP